MLTVTIIAKNEAANIGRCLQSVAFADEIIVLDSGSSDNTVEIAQTYTPLVYSTDWQGYGAQKQRALDMAQGDWVLNLDADEYVSEALQRVIQAAIQSQEADAYRIPIQMVFYNQPLRYCASPKRHMRLFKRAGAQFSKDIVHEKILLPRGSRVVQLQEPILHHSYRDVSHALAKINKYSSYSAKSRLDKHPSRSFLATLLATAWMFWRCYLLQRGFLDGRAGFLFAVFAAQGTFYRGIKQLYPDVDRETLFVRTLSEEEV